MAGLEFEDFPDSLLERIDAHIARLEELNPGRRWTRTACIATLVVRSLAQIEGEELRWKRRRHAERRAAPRPEPERRQGPPERRERRDRRHLAYPEIVDLVIDHLLKGREGLPTGAEIDDETWRASHRS